MGDQNNAHVDDNQNNDNDFSEQSQGQSKRSGNTMLDYSITPLKNAAVFTVHRQHPNVTDFLNRVGAFRAANGMTIMLGSVFPEWKESLDVVYLDGSDGRSLNRPDTTRLTPILHYHKNGTNLAVVKGREARNNKIRRLQAALAELCEVVSATYHFTEFESKGKVDTGRVRLS